MFTFRAAIIGVGRDLEIYLIRIRTGPLLLLLAGSVIGSVGIDVHFVGMLWCERDYLWLREMCVVVGRLSDASSREGGDSVQGERLFK